MLTASDIDSNAFNRAVKQKMVIEYLLQSKMPVQKQSLIESLHVSSAIVKSLVDKGVVKEIEVEDYRDLLLRKLMK